MDLTYPAEALQFAEEVRAFARAALPDTIREKVMHHRKLTRDEQVAWQRKLHERGWATPTWPKEYGGPGWSALEKHLFEEVMSEEGAPGTIPFGERMIAPVLMAVGSDAQKQKYLPKIQTLDYWFCQGFSEPGAGSDLASLKTRAVKDGDEWVITGQKMWTSSAHYANQIFLLARTDPAAKAQEGISMFVFAMDTPGITVRPTITIDHGHSVNETFFDDVRVPADSLIGEVNKGWTYAKLLLGHERTTIARIGQSKRQLRRLKALAAEQKAGGMALADTPTFRAKIADVEIQLRTLELMAMKLLSELGKGAPGVEANMLKIRGSEIQQTLTELALEAVGPYGLPFEEDASVGNLGPLGPGDEDHLAQNYMITRVVTIYGGSNEIQRNIIAKQLGL